MTRAVPKVSLSFATLLKLQRIAWSTVEQEHILCLDTHSIVAQCIEPSLCLYRDVRGAGALQASRSRKDYWGKGSSAINLNGHLIEWRPARWLSFDIDIFFCDVLSHQVDSSQNAATLKVSKQTAYPGSECGPWISMWTLKLNVDPGSRHSACRHPKCCHKRHSGFLATFWVVTDYGGGIWVFKTALLTRHFT